MACAAILLIGGKSERFLDPKTPKQFHFLSGKRVYEYSLETFLQSGHFSQILLACHKDWLATLEKELQGKSSIIRLVEGGSTRQESVKKSLPFLDKTIEKVLVHDGARPFVSFKMIEDLLDALKTFEASGTYIPSQDTIGVTDTQTIFHIPDRATMQRGQTPQSFHKSLLVQAHIQAEHSGVTQATCDIQLALRIGAKVKRIDGDETNIKITTPIDLYLAEHLLRIKTTPHTLDFDFRGKKIALIGASGGIGQQIHKELLKEGAEVIPLSRNSTPFSLDLLKTSSIKKTSKELLDNYGALDGCIFSAGCLHKGSIEKLEEKQVNEMARVNFLSLVPLLQHLPLKKEALFILIGSSSYFRGRKEIGVYSATKAASINLLQSLSEECPKLKIQIICPKRTDTPLRKKNFPYEDPTTLAKPCDVAKSILEKIKKNSCKGEILNLL